MCTRSERSSFVQDKINWTNAQQNASAKSIDHSLNRRQRRQGPILNVMVHGASKGLCLSKSKLSFFQEVLPYSLKGSIHHHFISIEMSPNATVCDVFKELQRRHVVPTASKGLELFAVYPGFSAGPLQPSRTLDNVGFQDGSHLHVYWRLRGGSRSGSGTKADSLDDNLSGKGSICINVGNWLNAQHRAFRSYRGRRSRVRISPNRQRQHSTHTHIL